MNHVAQFLMLVLLLPFIVMGFLASMVFCWCVIGELWQLAGMIWDALS